MELQCAESQIKLAGSIAAAQEETRLKKARAVRQAEEAKMLAQECEQEEAEILKAQTALGVP